MSLFNSFDLDKLFGELNSPRATNQGYLTPAARKATARANLGLSDGQLSIANVPAQNTTATLAAPAVMSGVITSAPAAAITLTLPTGTQMDTYLTAIGTTLSVGMTTTFTIVDTDPTNAVTLAAGTGFTLVGSGTIALSSSGTFIARRSAANTWVAYRE